MSGLKKSLRVPSSPKADFLYASFDRSEADLQRNRSNSEVETGRKSLSRPKKHTNERQALRRHTTDKTDINNAPRADLLAAMLEAQILETDEDFPKGGALKTPRITEWSERLYCRRRPESTRRSLVVLLYEGVLWTGPPVTSTGIYRDELLSGLTLLRQHCHVAVLLHCKKDWGEFEALAHENVDGIYSSRNTVAIGTGKKVWMQNYTQILDDFDTARALVVSCLSLSNDEYEGKSQDTLILEPFNGSWQFHV